MSDPVKPEILVMKSAIQQAFEMEPNPGNTVQTSQNPGLVHLNGFFNLQRAAAAAYGAIIEYQANALAQATKAAQEAPKEAD